MTKQGRRLGSSAFGAVLSGKNKTSPAAQFTVWNNGTISMKIQLQTNATSDPPGTGMTYNPVWNPGTDAFSLNTTGFTTSNTYIPINLWTVDYHTLASSASRTFGLRVTIGSPLTVNKTLQRMEIRFRGVSI